MIRNLLVAAAVIAALAAAAPAQAGWGHCHRGWGGGWGGYGCGYRGVSIGWGGGYCGYGGGYGYRNCGYGGYGGWGGYGGGYCGYGGYAGYGYRPYYSYVSYYRPNYFYRPYYGGYLGSTFTGYGSAANPIQLDAGAGYPLLAKAAPARPAPTMVVREFARTTPVVFDDAGIGYNANTGYDPTTRLAATPTRGPAPVVVPASYRPAAAPVTTAPAAPRGREF